MAKSRRVRRSRSRSSRSRTGGRRRTMRGGRRRTMRGGLCPGGSCGPGNTGETREYV